MLESEFKNMVVLRSFPSATTCYDFLAEKYDGVRSSLEARPRFLFRGEARFHPTSTPGTYRALIADSSISEKFARIDATGIFVEDFEDAGNDPDIGECLAQHYLSTSDGLDFSSSLGIALAFALDENETDAPRSAYIAVLDRDKADASNRLYLHDLRALAGALRPIRQSGFVAVHRANDFHDLKDAVCCRELGIRWYSFDVARDDISCARPAFAPRLDALYDIQDDIWAARMIRHLDALLMDPSERDDEGLRHLAETRRALLSRMKGE